MSHRALVAVVGRDGDYDVYLARDGAADPMLVELTSPGAGLPLGITDGPALGRADSLDEVLATYLDPIEHGALLVVRRDGTVTPYAVLAYVLATADGLVDGEPVGAVLSLVGDDGSVLHPAYVRGWTHGTAGLLGEAVDGDLLSPREALGWLADRARRLAGEQYEFETVPPRPR